MRSQPGYRFASPSPPRAAQRDDTMRRSSLIAILLALATHSAQAESCSKSREYLIGDVNGELILPAQAYEDAFKKCMAATGMANVKDAFVLKDGGIAVIPKQNTIAATAATLAEFCNAYPRAVLHFFTPGEIAQIKSISSAVTVSSKSSTTCQVIKGGS
jgi:hypothetical protein